MNEATSTSDPTPAPLVATDAPALPAEWQTPNDFTVEVEGEIVHVHYAGQGSVGYELGNLLFEFRGPNISHIGHEYVFELWDRVKAYTTPQIAARAIAQSLAQKLATEVRDAQKRWPRQTSGDMAIRVDGAVRRARLIYWNRTNRRWHVWLRREQTTAMIRNDAVLDDWTPYFATHLNPGDHVVYRSVSTILHGHVIRLIPGTAHHVEIQQPGAMRSEIVSPVDLIGLWDELSPAERGETFKTQASGLANNPFNMARPAFEEWVRAVDPAHYAEWSSAYRYFAEGFALSAAAWKYLLVNPHFAEKRRTIDPGLSGNPFDAPRELFIRWVMAHVDGAEAQAACLQGYAALQAGSEDILLPEARAYLVSQPLYAAAWIARWAATTNRSKQVTPESEETKFGGRDEWVVKRPAGLPLNVPEVIEVDVGSRSVQWVKAQIVAVAGQRMICRRVDTGDEVKIRLYGRDIEWRVPLDL